MTKESSSLPDIVCLLYFETVLVERLINFKSDQIKSVYNAYCKENCEIKIHIDNIQNRVFVNYEIKNIFNIYIFPNSDFVKVWFFYYGNNKSSSIIKIFIV